MRRTGKSMRRLISLAIIGIVFVCSFGVDYGGHSAKAVPVVDDCDWPMFGRTPEGNRVAPDGCGPKTDKLELKWKYWTRDKIFSNKSISDTLENKIRLKKKCDLVNSTEVGSITIVPSSVSMIVGTTMQFLALAFDKSGKLIDDISFTWSNNPTDFGTISSSGLFIASNKPGMCVIIAQVGDVSGTAIVNLVEISKLEINPKYLRIETGSKKEFSANAYNTINQVISGLSFQWTVTPPSLGTITSVGYFTCTGKIGDTGIVKVSAGGLSAEAKVTVGNSDNESPIITLVSPVENMVTMNVGLNKLVFKVEDSSGVLEVLVNGSATHFDGIYWSVSVMVNFGTNTFFIQAKDASTKNNVSSYNLTIIGADSNPVSITPTSLSYGTVNRGKSSLKSINLTFNTTSVLKGTVKCDKRWIEISPTSFDSNAGSLSIVCKIEASKLPGKAGEQTANITIDYYDIFGLNSPGGVRPSGQIVVPITISTEQTIDLDLKVKRSYAYIGKLKVDLGYPPFLKNGRLLVPIRFVSESFGCSVTWEPTQKMITIKRFDDVIIMWEGKKNIIVNGVEKVFDCPPVNSKNTTFVPIRVISEAFNASLQWFHKEQRLECKYLPPDDGY